VYGTSRHLQPIAGLFEMIQMDVDSDESVRQGIALLFEREGRLDVVINNAGCGIAGAIEDTSTEEAKAQLETNFFGVLRVCRAALPIMRAQRSGTIINISSIGGLFGLPFQGLYSASKHAVEGLSESLSMEVRRFGIRVVLVEPGDLHTGFTAARRRTAECQENPTYQACFDSALQVIEHDETHGAPPEQVARLVERIIHSRSPRLRYVVGPFFETVSVIARKVLSARLFEWIIVKYYRV
jgi:NAD(P)-dependent dehydrogenase (short-subunit alcohol dehydrogenase family)